MKLCDDYCCYGKRWTFLVLILNLKLSIQSNFNNFTHTVASDCNLLVVKFEV